MKKRILFLISDTGGGHRAAARAIDEAIHQLHPDTYKTYIEDIWKDHTPWPVNKIPNAYPWMTGPGIPMWKLLWLISTTVQPHKVIFPGVSPVVERRIVRFFHQIQPHIIVSVHPLMNHIGVKLRNKADMAHIPFVTIVTDMVSIHPAWICPDVTLCTVPTEPARQLAVEFGMSPERVIVTGQPVGLKFAAGPKNKAGLKRKLGLAANRPAALIVGGGEGFGLVYDIARAIAETAHQGQMMVVAGRNAHLQQKLNQARWEIPTKIFGFVDNMPELMGAADMLVTKAGPGTISEAFTAHLPLIVSGYIPGQETGNVVYIQEHCAGQLAESPPEIARTVADWMKPNNPVLSQMTRNAAALARPEAALTIAGRICDLI